MTKFILISSVIIVLIAGLLCSCARDKAKPDTTFTDSKFFALIKDTAQVHYYKDASNNSLFNSIPAHNSLQYKLRMNDKANNACTSGGKLPVGGSFPDSSLIVKELRSSASNPVAQYAALYKLGGTWYWAKYNADNTFGSSTVIFSINDDGGTNCASACHSSSTRDYVLTFDSHP